jgi:hypothetical protein
MKNVFSVALVAALALGSISARAADTEERSELRQRAEEYQSQRARNPEFQPGEGRLTPQQPAERPKRHKANRSTKNQAKSGQPETRRTKAAKKVRSLKKIPGAFVRK